jgi:hypothetical protein
MATYWVNESGKNDLDGHMDLLSGPNEEDLSPFGTFQGREPLDPLEEVSAEFLLPSERGPTPHSSMHLQGTAPYYDIESPPESARVVKEDTLGGPKRANGALAGLIQTGGKWLRLSDEVYEDEISI